MERFETSFLSTSNPTYRDDSVPSGARARRKAEAESTTSSSSAVAVASACHTVYMEIWNKATVDRVILLGKKKNSHNQAMQTHWTRFNVFRPPPLRSPLDMYGFFFVFFLSSTEPKETVFFFSLSLSFR